MRIDRARRLVRLTRTAEVVPLEQFAEIMAPISDPTMPERRAEYGLLLDMRLAPPRNDPRFELAVKEYLPRMFAGFGRIAILVKSAVGELQVQRTSREVQTGVPVVFRDEGAAIAFLSEPREVAPPAGPRRTPTKP
jgi:hypothetical protein